MKPSIKRNLKDLPLRTTALTAVIFGLCGYAGFYGISLMIGSPTLFGMDVIPTFNPESKGFFEGCCVLAAAAMVFYSWIEWGIDVSLSLGHRSQKSF